MDIFGGIVSLLGGGVTGVIGAGINKYFDFKAKQQDYAHALEMRKVDIQILDKEWEGRARVASVEGEAAMDVAVSKLQEASIEADKATYSKASSPWLVFVDVVRGLIRPLATAYFILLSTIVFVAVFQLVTEAGTEALTADQLFDIFYYCVLWVLYTAGMVVGWWFGVRASEAPALPKRK